MRVVAVLDLGTNSLKMHVARVEGGRATPLADVTEVTRLGEALHVDGALEEEAIARNAEAVGRRVREARALGADPVVAVGTMALRHASNAADLVDRVRELCGLNIEVIEGEEEARLSYLAARSALPAAGGPVCVFDIGGGSTEFILGEGARILSRHSLDLGCRRPTEEILRDDPVSPQQLERLRTRLREAFADLDLRCDAVIGVGGTVTTLGAVQLGLERYDPDRIHGATLTLDEVRRQVELFRSRTIEERKSIVGLIPARADVILAGATAVEIILETLARPSLIMSDRGLRHGVLLDRFLGGT